MTGGFWALYAVQTPGAPYLSVLRTSTNTVCVWWPVSGAELAVAGRDQPGFQREHLVAVFLRHERRELRLHRVAAIGEQILSADAMSALGAVSPLLKLSGGPMQPFNRAAE